MKLSKEKTIEQSMEILVDMDNVKGARTVGAAMTMIGVALMQPLRRLAENCQDPEFILQLEQGLKVLRDGGQQQAMFEKKSQISVADKAAFNEYLDYWLQPARSYKAWLETLAV